MLSDALAYFDCVSMPSRAYTSFLRQDYFEADLNGYASVNALTGLYLISTSTKNCAAYRNAECVNALTGLYLISTLMKLY